MICMGHAEFYILLMHHILLSIQACLGVLLCGICEILMVHKSHFSTSPWVVLESTPEKFIQSA